jgi:hypothetical protein
MRELVRLFSDPNEVIFDPHAGSGTTGVAALEEGRRVILVERDPEHAATARRRCMETVGGAGSRRAKQVALPGVLRLSPASGAASSPDSAAAQVGGIRGSTFDEENR